MTKAPIVKNILPSLYTENTKHMSKAKLYSYNYGPLDDYIVSNYRTKSRFQIARDLNEYVNRVTYRTRILVKHKVIVSKTKEAKLLKEKNKVLLQLELINKQLKVRL